MIYGDGGADLLDGGAGDDMLYANEFSDGSPDILRGGAGNDRYYISTGYQYGSSPDTVIELEGEGVDTVFAESFSYTLTANVENLVGVFNSSTWYWQNPSYPGWIVHIPRALVGNDRTTSSSLASRPTWAPIVDVTTCLTAVPAMTR